MKNINQLINDGILLKGKDDITLAKSTSREISVFRNEAISYLRAIGESTLAEQVTEISFSPTYMTTADMPDEWNRRATTARIGLQCVLDILEQVKSQASEKQNKRSQNITTWIITLTLIATVAGVFITLCK